MFVKFFRLTLSELFLKTRQDIPKHLKKYTWYIYQDQTGRVATLICYILFYFDDLLMFFYFWLQETAIIGIMLLGISLRYLVFFRANAII